MPEYRDFKQFLRALSFDELQQISKRYGGFGPGALSADYLIQWADTPQREATICDAIRNVFGVSIPTAAERQEERDRVTADATVKAADAAERSAREAATANETAKAALEVARIAHRAAHLTMIWTAVASVIAALAIVLALLK